jgi:hypothetical protein
LVGIVGTTQPLAVGIGVHYLSCHINRFMGQVEGGDWFAPDRGAIQVEGWVAVKNRLLQGTAFCGETQA